MTPEQQATIREAMRAELFVAMRACAGETCSSLPCVCADELMAVHLRALEVAGLCVVPIEPTPDMSDAAFKLELEAAIRDAVAQQMYERDFWGTSAPKWSAMSEQARDPFRTRASETIAAHLKALEAAGVRDAAIAYANVEIMDLQENIAMFRGFERKSWRLEQELAAARAEIAAFAAAVHELEELVNEVEAERQGFLIVAEKAETELDAARAEITTLKVEREALQSSCLYARTEIDRLRNLFHIDGEQHAKAIKEARHEQDARMEAYGKTLDAARTEIETLKTELDASQTACGGALKALVREKEELARLRSAAPTRDSEQRVEDDLLRAAMRNAPPNGDLRAENEKLMGVLRHLQKLVSSNSDIGHIRGALQYALASPQPDAGARGETTPRHVGLGYWCDCGVKEMDHCYADKDCRAERGAPSPSPEAAPRDCTCHPSEAPIPCQRKYALSECLAAAQRAAPPIGETFGPAHDGIWAKPAPDGAKAERILKMLREPGDEAIKRLALATCPDTQALKTCLCPRGISSRCWDRGRAALVAAAIEADPT